MSLKINMFGDNLIFQDMISRDIRGNFKLVEDRPAFRGLFREATAFEGFSRDSRDFRGQWLPCCRHLVTEVQITIWKYDVLRDQFVQN